MKLVCSRKIFVLVAVLWQACIDLPSFAADSSTTLTDLQQVLALSTQEGARGLPVKFQAVVTFCDRNRNLLFVQQGDASVSVRPQSNLTNLVELHQGQRLEVTGVTVSGKSQCNVKNGSFRVLEDLPAAMPPPLELSVADCDTNAFESRWVKMKGWVPTITKSGNRLNSQLVLGPGKSLELIIMENDRPGAQDLAGALVELTGVLTYTYDSSGTRVGGRLYVGDLSNIRKLKSLPVSRIPVLTRSPGNGLASEPVRLRGKVVSHNLGESLVVHDDSGSLRVPFKGLAYFNPGTVVEVFAWRTQFKPELVLANVAVRVVLPDTSNDEPASAILTPTSANTNLPTLIQTAQVRKLLPTEASRGYPIHIHGVITFYSPGTYLFFLQDESSGIYMDLTRIDPKPPLTPGQAVEIEGFSGPGGYAPVVIVQSIRSQGPGEFPLPEPATFRKLLTGYYDSQWVSLKGVVRNQWLGTNVHILTLFTGEGVVKISVPVTDEAPKKSLVDAAVEVRGVCTSLFDDRRRLAGVELHTPDWSQIRMVESAPDDPFKLAVKAINELFQFNAGRSELHRTRLMGVVTLRSADGSFCLQDASGAIQVQTQSSTLPVKIGDTVDVVGFPVALDKLPLLQDSEVRAVKNGTSLEPLDIKTDSPADIALNATLVRLKGQVIRCSSRAGEEFLSVQFGQDTLDVLLEKNEDAEVFSRLEPGTVVRLTGIYLPRLSADGKIQSFDLRLRSAADVEVLSRPSWWTLRRTFWVMSGVAAVLLLALLWVHLLRRQVQERTQELHAEIDEHKKTEHQLMTEIAERKRMETEVQKTHQELLVASRHAGMAEVATGVLHNVGNVLNSVNVSANVVVERVSKLKIGNLVRAAEMIKEQNPESDKCLRQEPKGQQVGHYLEQLARHLTEEQTELLGEIDSLRKNVEHIKEIVAMQQSYAKVIGVVETVKPTELIEDAVRMNQEALTRHRVKILRQYEPLLPEVMVDKHKVLQVLVNLISNAKKACSDSGRTEKRVTLRVANGEGRLKFSVADNGVGIAEPDLARIFNHGFTTRKDGHGFGLHSGALTAKELGGTLVAKSDGPGCGATFILELPAASKA